ncbi:MAG: Restriction endonuclease [Solirubrobacteraceae bacterium]|jgi:hypothetical protein|nr:Restriction endonuclease [Solirubrobacteraceae bacterium]
MNSPSLNDIQALHDELFEDRPKKRGTALERIVALVFAALDEGDVRHQQLRRGPGRAAGHWIDVGVEHPLGLAIIECKQWKSLVDQDVLNSVCSRRDQLGATVAVVVSIVGFTAGAIAVAAEEGVLLLRVSRLAPDDHWHGIVKEIRMRGTFVAPAIVEMHWVAVNPAEAAALASDPEASWSFERDPFEDRVEAKNGTPAERLGDLLAQCPSPSEPGRYQHEVSLDDIRYVRISGTRVAVRALRWVEEITVSRIESVAGPASPGVILVERVTANGAEPIRVLMDHELRAWRIAEDRRLVSVGGVRRNQHTTD